MGSDGPRPSELIEMKRILLLVPTNLAVVVLLLVTAS
jgi:hypothetical protein